MAEANVVVSVLDPDKLMSATYSPYGFAATKLKLYRYTSEALARAATSASPGGTLVTTFALVASDTPPSDPDIAGPFRYGIYDSSMAAGSWYTYFFEDAAGSSRSPMSTPWEGDNQPSWALRDILVEVGSVMGDSILKGVCGTNATASDVICEPLFKSTVRDARMYEQWWLLCSYNADSEGAAPEGEEALIASVNTTTGTATLERALTAAVTANDLVLISAYLQPSSLIKAINRARERMKLVVTHDIPLEKTRNKYPAPFGVRTEADVLDVRGVVVDKAGSDMEWEFEMAYRIEFDGRQGWLYIDEYPGLSSVARVRMERSYRDIEGDMLTMASTTSAPIEWLRAVAAFAAAEALLEQDPEVPEFRDMVNRLREDADRATGANAPQIVRRVKANTVQPIGPRFRY